ncbi:transporter [Pontibacillus salicampi]|uniref:Transporter n=1 Tax=Pontibacillus salicampi TaxID=1449801 RepID=A0ABV6LPI7_9BACI
MVIFQRLYEAIMIVLVMFTIMTLWTEQSYNTMINRFVWLVFFIDFIVRLWRADQKWDFMKRNPFLVIAVIPLDQFFQVARIVRLIYLFRIKTITKYYIQPFIEKITYQSKVVIVAGFLGVLAIQAIILWNVEANITSLWMSSSLVMQQLMFFGHRSIEVDQTITLWFFVFTSILGVLLHGLALQWVFSKLEPVFHQIKKSFES